MLLCWVDRDERVGVRIFTNTRSSTSFIERALTILGKYPVARQLYLQFLGEFPAREELDTFCCEILDLNFIVFVFSFRG
jgi:hypothetical protein